MEKQLKQEYPKSGGWRFLAFKDEDDSGTEDNIDV